MNREQINISKDNQEQQIILSSALFDFTYVLVVVGIVYCYIPIFFANKHVSNSDLELNKSIFRGCFPEKSKC